MEQELIRLNAFLMLQPTHTSDHHQHSVHRFTTIIKTIWLAITLIGFHISAQLSLIFSSENKRV